MLLCFCKIFSVKASRMSYALGSQKTLHFSVVHFFLLKIFLWNTPYFYWFLIFFNLSVHLQSLQLGCACSYSTCCPETCDHVYLFGTDYVDAKDVFGKPMRDRFPYDENGRIILEVKYFFVNCKLPFYPRSRSCF